MVVSSWSYDVFGILCFCTNVVEVHLGRGNSRRTRLKSVLTFGSLCETENDPHPRPFSLARAKGARGFSVSEQQDSAASGQILRLQFNHADAFDAHDEAFGGVRAGDEAVLRHPFHSLERSTGLRSLSSAPGCNDRFYRTLRPEFAAAFAFCGG